MTYHFGAGWTEYLTMYTYLLKNYDDADLAQDLKDKKSTSSIVITINQVAINWKISKQLEPTGVTTSGELCSAVKDI
eukprot:15333618-Ditylum_brightwellii.AAC.2